VKVVMRSFIYPFNKLKSGLKLEDKLPISSPCMKRSVWSYSYDLILHQISEAATQKATICDFSESEVEDESISRCNEDHNDDFIFEGNEHIDEAAAIDSLGESETEDVSYDSPENSQKHRLYKPSDSLQSLTVNETEQSVDNVKCLRFSDVQKQHSWLARTILPSPKEMGDSNDTKRTNKAKIDTQIQATLDYLKQFIPKTALPSLKKLVHLQMEYCREKMEWKKQVDFLKQKNSLLESELQNFKMAYRKAAKQLTNLINFQSQNESVVGRNFDVDKDSKVKSVENKKHTLSKQKYASEKEYTDVKVACYRTNHPEQEGNIHVDKNPRSEKFLTINKTLRTVGSISLKLKPFASRKISQDPINKLMPNDRKKLNLGSIINFQKTFDMEAWNRNEAISIDKLKGMNPQKIKSPLPVSAAQNDEQHEQ